MAETKSPSQTRVVLAQFLFAYGIDIETLYEAIGADITTCDADAVSHIAGVIDGVNLASSKISAHGVDNWARNF
ncbi:MAG: hypothetical protein EVA70_06465 [Parvularculaceae bacterium]|nr:MAG: hypothetical protein EVA70_06465 [Parvularculaceae bacterium]